MKIEDAIKSRKSVRRYSDKKPDWRKIIKAIDAARYAPMAGGIFSLKFILVSGEEKIKEIGKACQQDFVSSANYIVVAVNDDAKVDRSYDEMSERFARQQAGAAIENFLLEITSLGLATCWVGFYDEDKIKSVLNIPAGMVVDALFPIGNETKIKAKQKKKQELENIIYFDKYGNRHMKGIKRTSLFGV